MPSKTIVEKARQLLEHRPALQQLYCAAYKLLLPRRHRHYVAQAQKALAQSKLAISCLDDMVRETLIYGTFYDEYIHYRFDLKNDAQRRTYLTDAVRNAICRRINDPSAQALLMDKCRAAQHFGPLFGREFLRLDAATSRQEFLTLARRHPKLVAKPISNCSGRGVQLVEHHTQEEWSQWFESHRLLPGGLIVEQPIVQDPALSQWHPSSVNTIRTNTILLDGRFLLFSTFLRMGRGGSFMDNCGQGGLMCAVDPLSGRISTPAFDEAGHSYPAHPDTNLLFQDAQLPRWDELRSTAEKLARAIPQLTFVAWDLALTPQGWIMVEGNKGQFQVQQTVLQRGIRQEFESAVGQG